MLTSSSRSRLLRGGSLMEGLGEDSCFVVLRTDEAEVCLRGGGVGGCRKFPRAEVIWSPSTFATPIRHSSCRE